MPHWHVSTYAHTMTRVGTEYASWKGILGRNGIGKCNSNGFLLLETCSTHELLITNSVFRLPHQNKMLWMHPHLNHWHLLDYVIVRQRDRQDVQVTKAMCGAECWTDHRLLIFKLKIRIQPPRRPQGQKVPKRLNVSKLKSDHVKKSLDEEMESRLDPQTSCTGDIESEWAVFRDTIYAAASEVVGPYHSQAPRLDTWLSQKTDEIQSYAKHNFIKNYSKLKSVYGPTSSGSSPLLRADGDTLITDREILECWAEHFDSVLNRPSSINDEVIEMLPQVPTNHPLADVHTEDEEFKDASAVHLYKRKGNRQTCDNHRGISLLSIAGKILARVLLNRHDSTLGARSITGKPVRVQPGPQHRGHDLCCTSAFTPPSDFHDGMQACVQDDGDYSAPFPVKNGVKQGCVLAPTLFSMIFSAMLTDAFHDGDIGVGIRYRTDGKLFNLRRLQAKTKVQEDTLLQPLTQSPPSRSTARKFVYLGSTLSRSVTIGEEVAYRIARANAAFGRLRDSMGAKRDQPADKAQGVP
ncbi:uncharacterized protein LOC134776560 [Penaeus indicus]|uniref:uncharacterized protein LOC134776560 n=1 Tax=Penaeus indicus TaxID=29960 RepID=UPI00300D4832